MEYLKETKTKFDRILEVLKEEFNNIRTNRPSPKLIEDIKVNYMEQQIPIKQLGTINVEPPRDLIINMWDQNVISLTVNAIEGAGLGVNVSSQGKTIRVTLPVLTEERKKELIKLVKSTSEGSKIKMRLEREDAVKKGKGLKDEDERFRAKEKLQELVDEFNKRVDELVDKKTTDILE
ncbi:MAG: ribosome recycling factor [Candidatus Colwellbacteria bacterium CG10_big_fil_rev_8_21_14_0_10_42_22]|uniref:Ribosome recycling factor n=1 Tax=Candidatus Colwellbacteria bacterium CG10_big_fil_rev_8_21_14_0_10_42_22 TaxID=1974540 RepID=A0A2H0VFC6_9BACT|nr:MAG: ribosome recycling factor [Candidatus Colwellbacteria bacterium CG10_big_fil_rev_8_21_14_0_10_42_22]